MRDENSVCQQITPVRDIVFAIVVTNLGGDFQCIMNSALQACSFRKMLASNESA